MIKQKNSYLKVFLSAFCMFFLIVLPVVIYNKGYMTYYGDFNSQQLPFIKHIHESVRNGNIMWDWHTDLGSDFISTYSFYLLGSPFFWLMLLIPESLVLFSVPMVLSLKYAVAALTSYAYIKRFVKRDSSAVIGCFLYAFSGFQAYNIFFNHFHDVTALFPLMLIAMEEHITKNRRGIFALTVALMAVTNYFFFAGQAVFLIVYFLLRSRCRDFRVTPKKFFSLFFEALLGTAAAAFILLPSALSVLGNFRVSKHLLGMDMLAYSDRTRIWRIIQSFFMIPDSPARPNLFSDGTSKWSSIAGYLPMFSMAGVISFVRAKPDKWQSRLIKFCVLCAFIPVLNSMFYMFNSEYYARWFYMPVLIMAMVTAQIFERTDINPVPGFRACTLFLMAVLIISFLPAKEEDTVTWAAFGKYKVYLYISLGITAAFLIIAGYIFSCRKNRKKYIRKGIVFTVAASFVSTAAVFYFGIYDGPYPEKYIAASINDTSASVISDDEEFFRTDISENCDNYPVFWGYPSMRCFNSTVSSSIMEFYNLAGITRDVASRADTSHYALRGLLSVKYYFSAKDDENSAPDMPAFSKISDGDHFEVYENTEYVPMGFTYDTYITEEQLGKISEKKKSNALMHSVLLTEEQAEKYSDILEKADISDSLLTKETYLSDCEKRRNSSCSEFITSTNGFTARIKTDRKSLVFFSVPFDKGFTAYVNGVKTDIEKVDNGFMAVVVPEGESDIKFSYVTYGLETGIKISAAAFLIILLYTLIHLICRAYISGKSENLSKLALEIAPDDKTASMVIVKDGSIDIELPKEE
ncbi:MAG: YfhO family protein [Oscillospiraceae bacterium]|nr:YfhO family protein [Oscillospiraceae bacterium]